MVLNILNMLAESFDLPILDWIAEHLWCDFLDCSSADFDGDKEVPQGGLCYGRCHDDRTFGV